MEFTDFICKESSPTLSKEKFIVQLFQASVYLVELILLYFLYPAVVLGERYGEGHQQGQEEGAEQPHDVDC